MSNSPDDNEFFEMLIQAKEELKNHPEFQDSSWNWIHELDDEGFFIFCYLINDYNLKVATKKSLEDTVYTLVMLRHKFLPTHVTEPYGLSSRWSLQVLFNLYEKLKKQEMSWDLCQEFVDEQLNLQKEKKGN